MVKQCQVCRKVDNLNPNLSFHPSLTTVVCFVALLINIGSALPTDLQSTTKENETSYSPFSLGFRWTNYNIAAVAAGTVVVVAALSIIIAFFFPIFGYRVCYALGGCQNTLDNYVDRFIGVEGRTRRLTKRDVQRMSENSDMDYIFEFLKSAKRIYEDKATSERNERIQNNIMSFTPSSNHQIEKRSPLDYIEPILVMMSKAYNEYVDPELKKNFRRRRFIR